jgi:VanZ family protein
MADEFAVSRLVVAGVAAVLLVSAVVPTGDSVARPGPAGLLTLDLWLHAGGYFLLELAVLAAVRVDPDPPLSPPQTAVFTVVYGGSLEVLQSGLPYRTASVADGVANAVGVAVAFSTWLLVVHRHPSGGVSL